MFLAFPAICVVSLLHGADHPEILNDRLSGVTSCFVGVCVIHVCQEHLTPLLQACEAGSTDIVKLLANAKCDFTLSRTYGNKKKVSPFLVACRNRFPDIVEHLITRLAYWFRHTHSARMLAVVLATVQMTGG